MQEFSDFEDNKAEVDAQSLKHKVVAQEEKKPATQNNAIALKTNERGSLELFSLNDQLAFAKRLIEEKMISNTFQNPQQVVIGIQYAKALQMEPIVALKMMYVINGRPSLYSEGPLLLCQRSPVFSAIEEFFVDESGERISFENKNLKSKAWGSVTRVWRKGDNIMQEDYFTMDDLARAKLDRNYAGQKKEVWEKWERTMIRYKARSMALKSKFADLVGGIPIAEYDYDFSPEEPSIDASKMQSKSIAAELNDTYSGRDA